MLEDKLYSLFGFQSFKPGQKDIIEQLMAGKDVLAMLPTGRGKSLCYQLPGLLSEGLTIVVSPLLSLMEDQVQQLKSQGIRRVATLNSFTNKEERKWLISHLSKIKLLYTSPEMLQSDELINRLKSIHISYFIIDEAHCVSYWGHDFRADYLRLKDVRDDFKMPPCLAITATASPSVRQDIIKELALKDPFFYIESVNRENILLAVEEMNSQVDKVNRLVEYIQSYESPALVYVQTRAQAEYYSHKLQVESTIRVGFYHGGMENAERMLIQQQFMNGQLDVVCATSAFGMGLNKENIRYVIHLHCPLDIASYVQEIGRAGRDGKPSFAVLLTTPEDKYYAHQLVERGKLSEIDWAWALGTLQGGLPFKSESFESIVETINGDQARTAVFLLEQWGVIKNGMVQAFAITDVAVKLRNHFDINVKRQKKRLESAITYAYGTEQCKRGQLLHYFNEEPISQKPCCNVCGLDLGPFRKDKRKKKENETLLNAKEELKRIFGIERSCGHGN
ncbi:RecQ family ATP-dependent DNA helicase [Shouchella patagoniensis]|uniref:RecQ family ATP-dependent DNA helicase n=1 Tax=Shouchella patagoniensis TaxID=228576 RepID=UPI0009952807|nr:ATP-dependent DNA helicase RecQ [Shouchella patagoniensis]